MLEVFAIGTLKGCEPLTYPLKFAKDVWSKKRYDCFSNLHQMVFWCGEYLSWEDWCFGVSVDYLLGSTRLNCILFWLGRNNKNVLKDFVKNFLTESMLLENWKARVYGGLHHFEIQRSPILTPLWFILFWQVSLISCKKDNFLCK